MPDPTDKILPMLRAMRDEIRRGFEELRQRMESRFAGLAARLRAVENIVKAQREASEAAGRRA